jgi:hypothetical protein
MSTSSEHKQKVRGGNKERHSRQKHRLNRLEKRKQNDTSRTGSNEQKSEHQWSPAESVLGQADPELFFYLEAIDPNSNSTERIELNTKSLYKVE